MPGRFVVQLCSICGTAAKKALTCLAISGNLIDIFCGLAGRLGPCGPRLTPFGVKGVRPGSFPSCSLAPLLRGEGWGEGLFGTVLAATPLPNPPPQGGREKKSAFVFLGLSYSFSRACRFFWAQRTAAAGS